VPRFRFNLEAVLEQRTIEEQRRQRAVADLELQRLRTEDSIRSHQRTITHERSRQRTLLLAGDVGGARSQAAAAVRIAATAQKAILELSAIHARLESARAELLEATRRRKAVELLRERRFEEWKHQQNRLEAAANDELAVMKAARKDDTP
jgi:flagellar protein FliJ